VVSEWWITYVCLSIFSTLGVFLCDSVPVTEAPFLFALLFLQCLRHFKSHQLFPRLLKLYTLYSIVVLVNRFCNSTLVNSNFLSTLLVLLDYHCTIIMTFHIANITRFCRSISPYPCMMVTINFSLKAVSFLIPLLQFLYLLSIHVSLMF
jgi:hypothetical protein